MKSPLHVVIIVLLAAGGVGHYEQDVSSCVDLTSEALVQHH